jgi:hypothetical protein
VDGGAGPDLGADEATFDRYNWGWLGRDIETLGDAGLQIGPPPPPAPMQHWCSTPRRCSTGVRPRVGLGIRVATARRAFGCFRLAFKTYRAPRRLGLNSDVILPDGSDLSAQKLGRATGVTTLSECARHPQRRLSDRLGQHC